LTIHRDGKDGVVLATGEACQQNEGETDIHFKESNLTIQLVHRHHKLPSLYSKSSFEANGKKYYWKGHNQLYEVDKDVVIATFHPTWLEGTGHLIGTMDISKEYEGMQDIIVITVLVVHERSDEHRMSV